MRLSLLLSSKIPLLAMVAFSLAGYVAFVFFLNVRAQQPRLPLSSRTSLISLHSELPVDIPHEPRRIIAIGDIHGSMKGLRGAFRAAQLMDSNGICACLLVVLYLLIY